MTPRPIFIHGAGGGAGSWEHQQPRFEGCYVVSLPGHPAGTALATVAEYATWTARAIEDIPGPRVVVGHSLGGAIALQLVLERPDLVAGIAMIASGARLFVPDEAFANARADLPGECERLLRKGWPGIDEATLAAEVALMVDNGGETLLRDYAACRDFDVRARLDEVAVPVLVVTGDADALTPPWLAEELAAGLRHAVPAVVPGAGHWPMKEAPDTVDLLIAGFLARIELSGE